jgi:regulator of RNase E activity RraA
MTDDTTLLASLRQLPTTALSDAMDRLGMAGAMLDIRPLDYRMGRIAGRARTILQGPRRPDAEPGRSYVRHIPTADETIGPGEVMVIGLTAPMAASSWGHLLSLRCRARGAEGTIVDGPVRDPAEIIELGYPVFSRLSTCAAGSRWRLETLAVDEPVICGGVQVRPRDYVVGDDSGVVVMPAARIEEVAAIAREVFETEQNAARRIREGGKLVAALAGGG